MLRGHLFHSGPFPIRRITFMVRHKIQYVIKTISAFNALEQFLTSHMSRVGNIDVDTCILYCGARDIDAEIRTP
jgi:hypothetical protein